MIYPFQVYQSKVEDHVFWIARSSTLKGCIGQGDTPDEAIEELAENEQEWLSSAKETGIRIPDVPIEIPHEYSGKLTVRIAPQVHEEAAFFAKSEKISLAQYISDAIVNWNAHNYVKI